MTYQQLLMLRQLIHAEIEAALAAREEGSDGYRQSAVNERKVADSIFQDLCNTVIQP